MIYIRLIVGLLFCFFLQTIICQETASLNRKECFAPISHGPCFMLFLAWHYDINTHECVQFVYRGCGGNSNRFVSEEECYKKCGGEKLVKLQPPQNVTKSVVLSTEAYIYWYPPTTYTLHELTVNKTNETNVDYDEYGIQDVLVGHSANIAGHALQYRTAALTSSDETSDKSNNGISSHDDGSDTKTHEEPSVAYENVTVNSGTSDVTPASNLTSQTSSNVTGSDKVNITNTVVSNGTASNNNTVVSNGTASNTNMVVSNETASDTQTVVSNVTTTNEIVTQPTVKSATETVVPEDGVFKDGILYLNGTAHNISYYTNKHFVPYHFARLTHFVIELRDHTDTPVKEMNVSGDVMEAHLTDLAPGYEYSVRVYAVYLTDTRVPSKPINIKTLNDPTHIDACYCDPWGTKGGYQACNFIRAEGGFCDCQPNRSGLFCELCDRKYYRMAPSLPCHRCPCSDESSTGACHFVEGYLHCLACREGYTGNLCHRCGNGYYRDFSTNPSRCVKCRGCHNTPGTHGLICDPYDGTCKNCHFNTTGNYCDRCLEGFEGNPLKNVPCTPLKTASPSVKKSGGLFAAAIASVVSVVVIIAGVVGFICYKRSRNFPANKPFWTIEFKETHEDVNFSPVPEDEYERHQREYYDEESRKNKNLPKYQQLDEDC